MSVSLPKAPAAYSQLEEQQFRGRLETLMGALFGSGSDIRIKTIRVTLTSPDGTEYALAVDNTGHLSTGPYP